jgi:hypothetical protein
VSVSFTLWSGKIQDAKHLAVPKALPVHVVRRLQLRSQQSASELIRRTEKMVFVFVIGEQFELLTAALGMNAD